MMKIAIVTNIPAPYRVPIYKRIAANPEVNLQVIFCSPREPNRKWDLPVMEFSHVFLKKRFFEHNGRYIHNNPDVFKTLKEFLPDVVITTGFNPTHLYAFAYAQLKKCAHISMTDGTYGSEQILSRLHKFVRRVVYLRSDAFISASLGGYKLYESYGVQKKYCFKCNLCIENEVFFNDSTYGQKYFDFIFCARLDPIKNSRFALRVAAEAAVKLNRRVNILFVGSGTEEEIVKREAQSMQHLVKSVFYGFAKQNELPQLYRSARIFLFPSLWDPWGVVANEACAAGLPVIVSPHAGAAGELILDGENGFICDLDVHLWANRAVTLLTKIDTYKLFAERSRSLVSEYTFDNAAYGLLAACRAALL